MNLKLLNTIHSSIILWFVFAPFVIKSREWKFYYIWSVAGLVMHWVLNNNACVLSEIERLARGKEDSDDTFTQEILKPFFTLHVSDIDILTYSILMFNLLLLYSD
jgi:hypothetical protein